MTICVITLRDIVARNIAYWSASRVLRSRSYLFGGIMWHNGNSKWEPICVSRYKQCHFRAGHGFVFKPDANNNRALREEKRPPVLLPDPQNRMRNLPVGQSLPPSLRRPLAHLCTLFFTDVANYKANINETDALVGDSILASWVSFNFPEVPSSSCVQTRPRCKRRGLPYIVRFK